MSTISAWFTPHSCISHSPNFRLRLLQHSNPRHQLTSSYFSMPRQNQNPISLLNNLTANSASSFAFPRRRSPSFAIYVLHSDASQNIYTYMPFCVSRFQNIHSFLAISFLTSTDSCRIFYLQCLNNFASCNGIIQSLTLKGPANEKSYKEWDSLTAKFSGAANIPFLLLQVPQIILNAQNLLAGNKTALLALPWLGMLTCLLGNLSLLSYFAKKREKEAVLVQMLGVVSTYVIITQLSFAQAMPLPYFLATSVVVAFGLVLNFMNYFGLLNAGTWRFWEDFITVGGLSVLPQIMWSTFVPYIPNSILPGETAFVLAVFTVIMIYAGKKRKAF